jgi:hypothetical protein
VNDRDLTRGEWMALAVLLLLFAGWADWTLETGGAFGLPLGLLAGCCVAKAART